MNKALFLVVPALLAFYPIQSSAQGLNSWGSVFDCGVDWFSECRAFQEKRTDEPKQPLAARGNTFSRSGTSTAANLPLPVRNVLENPSAETAKAYVLWSRQASENLAKASEYIAQATREINSEVNSNKKSDDLAIAGVGPAVLYYFFSPSDPTVAKDVAVLNKIWLQGRIGVVGIPFRGNDEQIVRFVNETAPLFPVRRSDGEVQLIKPTETPELYLALPLEKKIFRLGPTITEAAIAEAIGNILGAPYRGKSTLGSLRLGR
jgi:hypothetical protein